MDKSTTSKKYKILIAEDDLESQKFLELLLSKHFEVAICDCSDSFYRQFSKTKFDLILMDITLKESKSGLDLTRELRASKEHSSIPILCLSAHVFDHDKRKALSAGVDEFLVKPVSNEVLINSIKTLIEKKSLQSLS